MRNLRIAAVVALVLLLPGSALLFVLALYYTLPFGAVYAAGLLALACATGAAMLAGTVIGERESE